MFSNQEQLAIDIKAKRFGTTDMRISARRPRPRKIAGMEIFPLSLIVNRNVDLTTFDERDWVYDPIFSVIFVRQDSKLFSWLALAT